MVAGKLEAEPTVTTTGWGPAGILTGMLKLICVTPTDQLGMPMNANGCATAMPPTVIDTVCCGTGTTPLFEGVQPANWGGLDAPSPVMYITTVSPA